MGINFSKVSYTYSPHKNAKKNQYVLDNIDLNIENSNEFIAIVGHTGSGKSTLIQLMNALLIPTTGEVKVDDNIITNKTQKNLKEIRKKIGLVFQFPEYQLFEETVLKDTQFGPKNFGIVDPEKRAKDALNLFGLGEDYYERSPFRLSGGEMRKVAISGILASDPNILILDEPTVGLDPITKKELTTLLKKINHEKNKTIIVVTHDMDFVWNVATRVIVLDNGNIVFNGSKKDLFSNDELVNLHSLDYPEIIKIMKTIKNKLNIDLDIYQDNLENAFKELEKRLSHE